MKRIVYTALVALALAPTTTQAASSYLHLSEAHSFRDHFAAQYDTRLAASRVDKGACQRADSTHIACPVTFYRWYQWPDGGADYQRCPYLVRVAKAHHGRYGTRTRGAMTGYCGHAETAHS